MKPQSNLPRRSKQSVEKKSYDNQYTTQKIIGFGYLCKNITIHVFIRMNDIDGINWVAK